MGISMKELIETNVRALVDNPDQVIVTELKGTQTIILEIGVAKGDLGKVIGKAGRIAEALRTILGAASATKDCQYVLQILE